MKMLVQFFRKFNDHHLFYSTKILIVMTGAVIVPMLISGNLQLSPILGAVAAALTDLDDHIKGRIKNMLGLLLLFFIAATIIELLFPYPFFFLLLCIFGTAFLMLLGALGERFGTIAFGTLVLMIYSMLTFEPDRAWYIQPLLLTSGALWYNVISLIFNFFWPAQPIRESLATCYKDLARFIELKSRFFDPDEIDSIEQLKLKLSVSSQTLTTRLNNTRGMIMRRMQKEPKKNPFPDLLNSYMIAQTLFERSASIHVEYGVLHEKFRYSDLLFRFQRLMLQQSNACLIISESILQKNEFHIPEYLYRLTTRLDETIQRFHQQRDLSPHLLIAIEHLLHNLKQVNHLFVKLQSDLDNDNLKGEFRTIAPQKRFTERIQAGFRTICAHLTKESPIFRHAIRMSFVMGAGYLIIWGVNFAKLHFIEGEPVTTRIYWIILTAIFVCQPNYLATKSRIVKRLSGTILGVVATIILLQFSPSISLQALIIILSGTLFFTMNAPRYSFATALLTMMILLGFNLNDAGFIAPERIIDTIIGCILAWIAVNYILPDWKYFNPKGIYERVAQRNSAYLIEIQKQYHEGREDNLTYLTARERASEADSELASLFSTFKSMPQQSNLDENQLFSALTLNNTLLGYLSALGAHREKIDDTHLLAIFDKTTDFIINTLKTKTFDKPQYSALKEELIASQQQSSAQSRIATILLQQLLFLLRTLPRYLKTLFHA